jgi:hypothetical protein
MWSRASGSNGGSRMNITSYGLRAVMAPHLKTPSSTWNTRRERLLRYESSWS